MVFLLAIGLVAVALGNFAVNSVATTENTHIERNVETNAANATTVVIHQLRNSYSGQGAGGALTYSTLPSFSAGVECSPSGLESEFSVKVYCTGAQTGGGRVINFYTCGPSAGSVAQCAGAAYLDLHAQVTYSDTPAGGSSTSVSCSATSSSTCGVTLTVGTWDVSRADT